MEVRPEKLEPLNTFGVNKNTDCRKRSKKSLKLWGDTRVIMPCLMNHLLYILWYVWLGRGSHDPLCVAPVFNCCFMCAWGLFAGVCFSVLCSVMFIVLGLLFIFIFFI